MAAFIIPDHVAAEPTSPGRVAEMIRQYLRSSGYGSKEESDAGIRRDQQIPEAPATDLLPENLAAFKACFARKGSQTCPREMDYLIDE